LETHLGHRETEEESFNRESRFRRVLRVLTDTQDGRGVPSSKQRRLENSYPLVAGRITLIYRQEAGGKYYVQ
jgi:hypothetical protein